MSPGTGDDGYAYAFERIVAPALAGFGPDLIFVSAGQDPAASDPLGRMCVTTEGFRDLTARAMALAGESCEGRLVVGLGDRVHDVAHCRQLDQQDAAEVPRA